MTNDYRQMTIFDVPRINFEVFRDKYCKHQMAYLSFGDEEEAVKACNYKNGQPAKSWNDWQKCTEADCPFWKEMN